MLKRENVMVFTHVQYELYNVHPKSNDCIWPYFKNTVESDKLQQQRSGTTDKWPKEGMANRRRFQ